MKHIGFYLVGLLIFVASCVDDDFSAGSSFIKGKSNSILVDTATVNLVTVLSDSTLTSGIQRILMGRYESADFGIANAESFLSFELPNYSNKVDFNKETTYKLRLDSVCLILPYDNYSYGDTTQVQKMNIYNLTDRLDELYTLNNSRFYSHHFAKAESTPYLTKTFKRLGPSASKDTAVVVRLPDVFGQAIMDSAKAQSKIFDSESNFIRYFKGFKLASANSDKFCINSFRMTSTVKPLIRIYYRAFENEPKERTITINANTAHAFSHISQDRSGTLLGTLTSKNGISSSLTGNKSYLQGMTGVYSQISFPHIKSLMLQNKYTSISNAYLLIYPVKNSFTDFSPLPKAISLTYTSRFGSVKDSISVPKGLPEARLIDDPLFVGRHYYRFDVTSFVQSEMQATGIEQKGLQLNLSGREKTNTFKSLIIADHNNPNIDYRIKLVIQLLTYKND